MLMGGIQGPIWTPLCALRVVFQGSKVLALEISAPCPAAGGATPHVQLMLVAGGAVRMLNVQWVLAVERKKTNSSNDRFSCFSFFVLIVLNKFKTFKING